MTLMTDRDSSVRVLALKVATQIVRLYFVYLIL
jgi:phosphoinositide-3-kinase regulatory subunit 4